jgi:hypothetical protein
MTFIAHMFLLLIPDDQSLIRRLETNILHRLELEPLGRDIEIERIKMPKRGVNWAFLKVNCKN